METDFETNQSVNQPEGQGPLQMPEPRAAVDTALKAALEAIIYAADEPVTLAQLVASSGAERPAVRRALDELIAEYQTDAHGMEIREIAGGFKFYTKPHLHDVVRKYIKSLQPPLRLSLPALETLAVIAYRQPVTLPEINEIRGVNCAGVINTLLERKLITTAGRKQVLGRPILYKTTREFLIRFGLASVDDLPSLKEFEELAREALGPTDSAAAETETSTESAEAAGSEEAIPEASGYVPETGPAEAEEASGDVRREGQE
jgi:segregation and condensation protein B